MAWSLSGSHLVRIWALKQGLGNCYYYAPWHVTSVLCVLPTPLECQPHKGRNLHLPSLLSPWHMISSQSLSTDNQGVWTECAHVTQPQGPHHTGCL